MSSSKKASRFSPTGWTANRIFILAVVLLLTVSTLMIWWSNPERARVQKTLASAGVHSVAMTVYKSPTCDCCGKWIAYLRERGFTIRVVEEVDQLAVQQRFDLPNNVLSCHTATINDYIVEGHVPVDDIVRLLVERPAVAGIAVPGMPTGSPGMDGRKDPYTVVSFERTGVLTTFAER